MARLGPSGPVGSRLPAESRPPRGGGAGRGEEASRIPPRVGPEAPPLTPPLPPDWRAWEKRSQSQPAAECRWDAASGEGNASSSPGISLSRARASGLLGVSWAWPLKGWGWPEPGRGAPEQPTPGRKGTLGNGLQELGVKATFSSLCSPSQLKRVAHRLGGLGFLLLFSEGRIDLQRPVKIVKPVFQ